MHEKLVFQGGKAKLKKKRKNKKFTSFDLKAYGHRCQSNFMDNQRIYPTVHEWSRIQSPKIPKWSLSLKSDENKII